MEEEEVPGVTEHDELAAIDHELSQIEVEIVKLSRRKQFLNKRKDTLNDQLMLKKSEAVSARDWEGKDFTWFKDVMKILNEKFKINKFRPLQLSTINAVLSKEDTILIMPTGGGKSLCYQIPSLINKGFGLVVSPLLSLMEDQIRALEKLGIMAFMLSANSSNETTKKILTAMSDTKSPMKILYATPERLSKSKRFMNKVQAAFSQNRLSLIAIDEVHCCSQWGHDFRPDYKFLGVLRAMFPGVPILGVTATATSKIIVDVQKMLDVSGCLVLKASFNRPNLFYEVREKPTEQAALVNELEYLVNHRFRGKSGIIYTTLIKEAEDLYTKLKERKICCAYYHANLDAEKRSKAHQMWSDGKLQVIIATVAFGMGIDKPDVRFVIHHSLPKSMESLYQESGRAGRDGQKSDCILYFRIPDAFKVSTIVFTQQTGLENLYNVVSYCLDKSRCRRQQFAYYFDETWESSDCHAMCDVCQNPRKIYEKDVGDHCRVLYKLMDHAKKQDSKLTCIKLLDLWFNTSSAKARLPDHKAPAISKTTAEAIIGHLLCKGYLKEDFHFTPYSTISYLKRGPMTGIGLKPEHRIMMKFAVARTSNDTASPTTEETPKEEIKCKSEKRPRKRTEKNSQTLDSDDVPMIALSDSEDAVASRNKKKRIQVATISDSE